MKQLFTHQRSHHQGANNLLHNVFAPLKRIALLALMLCSAWGAWGQIWVKVNGGTEQQISSLSAITNPASVTSLEVTKGNFTTNDWSTIKNFSSLERFIIIPGTQVASPPNPTGVLDKIFNISSLKYINLAGITTIPSYFLALHTVLTEAVFPDAEIIETQALTTYAGNSSLSEVCLPKVKSIGQGAFQNCDKLTTLKIAATPPSYIQSPKLPDNRFIIIVDETGTPLSGDELTKAEEDYKYAETGNPQNNWYGWYWREVINITFKANDNGNILRGKTKVKTYTIQVLKGEEVCGEAEADDGYEFDFWDDGYSQKKYCFEAQTDKILTASFHLKTTTYKLKYEVSGSGYLREDDNGPLETSISKEGNLNELGPKIWAIPSNDNQYKFWKWNDGFVTNPRQDTFLKEDPTAITALFVDKAQTLYDLKYSSESGGTLNGITHQRVYPNGYGEKVKAIANSGQMFVRWSDGRYDNPRQDVNVTKEIDVTAQFAPSGTKLYTLTYTAGQGGYIDGTATQQTAQGWNGIPVEAKPNSGYTFVRWSDGRTDNPRTDEDVRGNINVEAQFVKTDGTIWYTLTYNTTGDGSIVGPTTQLLPSGWNGVMVTANPGSDIFHRWSDGSTNTIHQATNVTKDTTITAEFVPSGTTLYDLYYNVDDTKGNLIGSATQKVIYSNGCGVEVEVVEIVPGTFLRWNDGNPKAKRKDCDLTTNPTTYTAEFVTSGTQIYKVKYIVDPDQGYFDGYAEQNVASDGCGIEIEAKEKPGYTFLRWSDGNPDAKRKDCGADIKGDATFTAEFVPLGTKIYTLTYSYNTSEGVLTGHAIQNVAKGGCGVEVEITAESGYQFLHWSDGSANPKRQDCNITSDTTITATFVSSTTQTWELKYYPEDRIDGPTWQRVVEGGNGVAVTAKENGDIFVRWSDGDTIAKRQDMNVTDDITVTAEFVPVGTPIYYVEYIAGTGGKIEPASLAKQKVPAGGNTVEIEAKGNPETDFMFTGWSDNLKTSKRSDKVTANAIYTANFTPTCCKTHWHYDTTKIAQNPCGEYTFQFPWGDTRDTVITDSETYTFTVRKDIGTGTCSAGSGIECDSLYILRVKFLPSTEHYFHVLVDDEFKYKGKTYTCSTANDTILYIFDDEYDISNCDTLKIYVHFNHPKPLSTSNVAAERINLYPNPTNTGFYIEAEAREVTVSSINGQLLHRQAISGKTYVDISHLPAGVYMVRAGSAVAKVVRI